MRATIPPSPSWATIVPCGAGRATCTKEASASPASPTGPASSRRARSKPRRARLDWLPTIAALTGAPAKPEARWEGTDIWPLLTGAATTAPPRILYWKTPREFALREGDWKLIEPRRKGSTPTQLFNLAADPLEKTDLAAQEPDRVAKLRELLKQQQALDPR